ncbi:ABC transporter substrate-binding protein [Polystyrenella longa]|uniref:ABC transporter substrate-binding protein n=1 Tax=Polystyrenella longa TaxID=2528007 RepID=UPI0018D26527|nr:ABC transporter substrate-binding protein [Polystyrenella longa]
MVSSRVRRRAFALTTGSLRTLLNSFLCFALLAVAGFSQEAYAQDDAAEESPAAPAASENPPAETEPPAESDGETAAEPNPETNQQNNQSVGLPRLEDLLTNFPTAEELMTKKPSDWLVLNKLENGKEVVLEVQPVAPRPDTLQKIETSIDEFPPFPRDATDKQKEQHVLKREQLFKMSIFLPDDKSEKEYFLDYRQVDRILYHEDKLLQWVTQYGNEGKFREAFDLLFKLKRLVPDWPGVEEQHDKLLQIEAQYNLDNGNPDSALALLMALYDRNRKFQGLSAEFGKTVNKLVDESLQQEQYRRARFYLGRLRAYFPDNPLNGTWESRLNNAAQDLIQKSLSQYGEGNYSGALESVNNAAEIWPEADRLNDTYRRIAERYQVLKVGVLRFADDAKNYPFETDAEVRIENLKNANLFEKQSAQEVALYSSPYLSNWVPTRLGKKLTFDLRAQFQSWEPYQPLNSFDIYDALQRRLEANSPDADERLRNYIERVDVKSPSRFEITFSKVPLRPEALLSFPVEHRVPNPNDESNQAINDLFMPPSRFELQSSTETTRTYVRSTSEPSEQTLYHVAAVEEIKYESLEKSIQGLVRGEISMLPSVRGELVSLLQDDGRFFVQRRSLPQSYVLQFNPNTEMLKNRELRRGLAYAIDRQEILQNIILQSDNPELGRVISAPFPSENQAYDPLSELRPYDLTLAYSLVEAAKANLKEKFGPLKLICVPDPRIRQAAEKMVQEWGRIGLEIELLDENAATDRKSGWDLVLREHRMAEPIVELWPYMTMSDVARAEDLVDLPSWLRQELVDLENAGDLRTATRSLHMLHNQLQANVEMIPLWEVNDYIVLRKTVTGFPLAPVYPYQGVEQWSSQAWFPTGF